jgi:geranylgeranyl diphosphate synthase type II
MPQVDQAIAEFRGMVETALDSLLPPIQGEGELLREAARYAVLGQGKRLRPVLALITADMLGVDPNIALQPACAIELIHSYSLIHDDLPCMDDDDFRRGRPTVHKAYDEATAVLTGDLLLTQAFEIIATAPNLSAEQRITLTRTLAQRSGDLGLILGQHLDMQLGGNPNVLPSKADIEAVHLGKTAALICAAVEFGGIIADTDAHTLAELRAFGALLGLAFQITDDILDVTASEVKHGRTIATDQLNDKATYVALLGLEGAREEAYATLNRSLQHLHEIDCDTSPLETLARSFVVRSF